MSWRSAWSLRRSLMSIVGGFDLHRQQITFDYVVRETGEVARGRIAPADREGLTDRSDAQHLRELLAELRVPESWIPLAHVLEVRTLAGSTSTWSSSAAPR